jgi:hypothetical protein
MELEKVGDKQVKFNPYVYMNTYKFNEVFGATDPPRINKEFSMFNRRYVYPYDVIPNPLKIKPQNS